MTCESCQSEITRNDRTAQCPKCGRWRCIHCDVILQPCVVCRNEAYCASKEDADTGNPDPVCADCGSDLDEFGNCKAGCGEGGGE